MDELPDGDYVIKLGNSLTPCNDVSKMHLGASMVRYSNLGENIAVQKLTGILDKYGSERSGGPVELHLLRESGVPSSNEETLKENELQQENYLLESSSILLEGNHIPSKERDYILFFDPKTNEFTLEKCVESMRLQSRKSSVRNSNTRKTAMSNVHVMNALRDIQDLWTDLQTASSRPHLLRTTFEKGREMISEELIIDRELDNLSDALNSD